MSLLLPFKAYSQGDAVDMGSVGKKKSEGSLGDEEPDLLMG